MLEQPPVANVTKYWLPPPILKENEAADTIFLREKCPPSANVKDIESHAAANLSTNIITSIVAIKNI